MDRRQRALKINELLFSKTELLPSMNSNELLTLITAINGWDLSESDEKRLQKMEDKIRRYENTEKLPPERAREIFETIATSKNKRSMRYYALKFGVSIAALVRMFQELPEHLLKESLFMYDGIKFPDGTSITRAEYERITGLKHFHRNHENFGKKIRAETSEAPQDRRTR